MYSTRQEMSSFLTKLHGQKVVINELSSWQVEYFKYDGKQIRRSRQLDNRQQAGALIYGFVSPCYM